MWQITNNKRIYKIYGYTVIHVYVNQKILFKNMNKFK